MTAEHFKSLNIPVHDPETGGDRRLRIFMPADSPSLDLCKTIMSSVALGYPLPTLLNWYGEFNHPEWHFGGSHIAKLESLLAVIDEILRNSQEGDSHDDDLAMLVDAYDIWFQLPPSVLIRRYHQLNREADERVRQQWDGLSSQADTEAPFPVQPPRQKIIITSAKHCSPLSISGSSPHYAHWPQSPMPTDMYGETTDEVIPFMLDPARRYKNIRPRCVNSGLVMGTMGALRASLTRARDKVEAVAREGRQLWSDQSLIGEVIGDQEMWREWMRELASTWNGTASENRLSSLDPEVRRIAHAAMEGTNFEFGIGLDYNFTTIPATCSSEEDAYFVKLNDKKAVEEETIKAGVPGGVRVDGIPPELLEGLPEGDPLRDVSWGDEPLYTDFFFGNTPVGIHHNAYVGNLKPWRLENWWDRTWFFPRLRELVLENLKPTPDGDARPLATLPALKEGGEERVYRLTKAEQRDKRVLVYAPGVVESDTGFAPIEWDGVCQKGSRPWHEKLFGDGKGPLY